MSQFFVGKATPSRGQHAEHLIGPGVLSEHFNDDWLGRVPDRLYEEGTTKVFVLLALKAARHFGLKDNHTCEMSVSGKLCRIYPSDGHASLKTFPV